MRKLITFILAASLMISATVSVVASGSAGAAAPILVAAPTFTAGGIGPGGGVLADTAKLVFDAVKDPQTAMVGGDWAVFGLARSGFAVSRSWFDTYLKNVTRYVAAHGGVLDERKNTEYSRVIIAMTAAGFDPRDVGGYDLTAPLGDYDKTILQGINGAIFALIALDSAGYAVPVCEDAKTQATREAYIAEILRRQLPDGGFSLSASSAASDADITGMALQALSKYPDRADVKAAIDKALTCLSEMKGGYSAWGNDGSESVVQVIVALCELGIGTGDKRFVKNGVTLVDKLMGYYVEGKGFEQKRGGGANNMATEQALYALAAVYRFENGMASLYDMSDTGVAAGKRADGLSVAQTAGAGQSAGTNRASGLPGKNADVRALPVIAPGKTFSDISANKYRIAIEALCGRGIINGRSASAFEPDATMTRAEFATIVSRGLGLPPGGPGSFHDVGKDDWFFDYVGAAHKYGIVNGVSATSFNPYGDITREEAATMIGRTAGLCGIDTGLGAAAVGASLARFADGADVSGWARAPVAFCCEAGILTCETAQLKPAVAARRGEIAGMLYETLLLAELI